MDKLPLTYKPKCLRKNEKENSISRKYYRMGTLNNNRKFNFVFGSWDLSEVLDVLPDSKEDWVILCYEPDDENYILYAWNHANSCWCLMQNFD